jgi:hypothetical protein
MWSAVLLCACAHQASAPVVPPPDATEAGLAVRCAMGGADADEDGLADSCELDFARAFAPMMVTASEGCNWDTSVEPARLGGEYLFAVQEMAVNHVRIAYLPAYYRDCGWQGIKCWLPFVDCAPHDGDSEAVIIDVVRGGSTSRWHLDAVFLSAHCFGHGTDCRWYRGAELDRFEWVDAPRGVPVVWVAEGRQANYPSRSACDAGHSTIDTCDRNAMLYRFPIRGSIQNIGSRARPRGSPGGCFSAAAVGSQSAVPVPGVEECFWSDSERFGGWQRRDGNEGSTPYARYLVETGEF